MNVKDLKPGPYTKWEIPELWVAHCLGDRKAPAAARARCPGEWAYSGGVLFKKTGADRWTHVASFMKRGKEKYFLVETHHLFARSGWRNTTLHSVISSHLPSESAEVLTVDFPVTYEKIYDEFWRNVGSHYNAYKVAKLFHFDTRKLTTPQPAYVAYSPRANYRSKTNASGIVEQYTPEARAKKRAEQKHQAYVNRLYRRARDEQFQIEMDLNHAKNKLYNLQHGTGDNIDMLFEHYGYKPQPGDLFKRLNHDRKARHGQWPAVGEWTHKIEELIPCSKGWHVCGKDHLSKWPGWGDHVYLVSIQGERIDHYDKVVAQQARLDRYIGDFGIDARKLLANTGEYAQKIAEAEKAVDTARQNYYMREQCYGMLTYLKQHSEMYDYVRTLGDPKVPLMRAKDSLAWSRLMRKLARLGY